MNEHGLMPTRRPGYRHPPQRAVSDPEALRRPVVRVEGRGARDRLRADLRPSATIIEAYRHESGEWSDPLKLVFDEPADLWDEIRDFTRVRARTWLCGWKLGDELRIAQAFKWMKDWTVNPDVIISDTTLSVGWHDDAGRSLLAVDLLSYLPTDVVKLRSLTATFSDADAIFKAFMDLVVLQHDYDLGNFARTGASNASNHFRHRHMEDRIYVHDDAAALEAERASVFTGRTEAWRHGTFGHLDEWDLPLAYARVGLDTALPVRLLGLRAGGVPPRTGRSTTYLGLARVRTDVPVLPCRAWWTGRPRPILRANHVAGRNVPKLVLAGARARGGARSHIRGRAVLRVRHRPRRRILGQVDHGKPE